MNKKIAIEIKIDNFPIKIINFSSKAVFDYVCKNDVKNILFIFATDKNELVTEYVKKSTKLVSHLKGVVVDFYQLTDQHLIVKFDEQYDLIILADDYRVYNFARLNFDKEKVITLSSNLTNITYALSNLVFEQNCKLKANVLNTQFNILNKVKTKYNAEFYGFVAYAIIESLKKLIKSPEINGDILEVFNFLNYYVETFIANNRTNLINKDVKQKMIKCLQFFFQFQSKEIPQLPIDKVCSLPELYYQFGVNGDKLVTSILKLKLANNIIKSLPFDKERIINNLKIIKEKILYFEKLVQEKNSKEEKYA